MAECILREMMKDQGITVSSAGTHAFDGFPASALSVRVMADAGYDISGHQARTLTKEMLHSADLVLAMAPEHIDFIERMFPGYSYKAHLLRRFGERDGWIPESTVYDPIGGGEEVYYECLAVLEREIERIVPIIIASNKGVNGEGDISN